LNKNENNSLELFVGGIILTGLAYFYLSVDAIFYLGILMTLIGLISFMYPLISKRKQFSNAELATIDEMSGKEFEEYSAYLMSQLQFERIKLTKDYGDQGIDLIATKNGIRYGIQCKRWKKKVGNKAIQEVYAGVGYYSLDKAVVLTNSYFTDSAKQLSKKLNVELWDRATLTKMIENSVSENR
jgi:restriction system protein